MSKHTPGPWRRYANSIISPKGNCVVVRLPALTDCFGDETPQQIERWGADAQLIAAAPELLAALEGLFDEYEDRRAQFCEDPLWKKWERVEVFEEAGRLLDELKGDKA